MPTIRAGDSDYRFRVLWVLAAGEDTVFVDGTESSREFRTRKGADAYADRLRREGRGREVLIQTGKVQWFTAAELEEELSHLPQGPPVTRAYG